MSTDSSTIHVLLVEDNPGDVLVITSALEDSDVPTSVALAEDGIVALDYLYKRGDHTDAQRPDLVLLDINMPRLSGLEVLSRVKSDPDLASIPVIMLTSSDADSDVQAAYQSSADAYLTKGFDFDELERTLKETMKFWFERIERSVDDAGGATG